MLLSDKAIFFFFFMKSVYSYRINVLLSFPEVAITSWKLKIRKKKNDVDKLLEELTSHNENLKR